MALPLRKYEKVVGKEEIDDILALSEKLRGKRIQHINSTAVGGGVAEILARMVPLLNEVGIRTTWNVIKGGGDFFKVTKAFHNALHGKSEKIDDKMLDIYLRNNEVNAENMNIDADFVFIHDPQPAALINTAKRKSSKWIWRCHIDVSKPQSNVWRFLKKFIKGYDAAIFSTPFFARKDLSIRQFLVPPSIDPFSEKNREISENDVQKVIDKYDIDPNRPIITQISRFDRLKDPLGVIQAYRIVKRHMDCQLVLTGSFATDDPEGLEVYREIHKMKRNDKDIHILVLPPFSDLEINALQRASTVILQKSIKEGFGLTVSEALWKAKPVVATATGGITLQVKNGLTGCLVYSIEGAAYKIKYLINNPEFAKKLGTCGREYVRQNFLLTRHLRNYLTIMHAIENESNVINL